MKTNKKGAMDLFQVVALVVLVIIGANVLRPGIFSGIAVGEDGVVTQVIRVEADKACGSTTMTVDFVEKYTESVDVTAQNATIYLNGGKKGIFSEGGTFTAQGDDELNVYPALDPAQETYYASHAQGIIPCTGQTAAFLTSASFMGAGSLTGISDPPNKIYKSSTAPSVSLINLKDFSVNPTSALSIGAGGRETVRATITWTNKEGYGVAAGNTLACRMTDSQFKQSDVVVTIVGGATLTSPATYVPTNTIFPLSGTNQTVKTWNFPAIDGKLTGSTVMDIILAGDDNNAPDKSANFSCSLLDTDLFELDSGGVSVGVEDIDDNSNIGRSVDLEFNIALSD